MQQLGTISVLTSQEACSLVYDYLCSGLDEDRRHRLAQYRAQFTATGLGSNGWHVFTWLAGFGQWHVSGHGARPEIKPADDVARRSLWQFEQN
jgi:hypothetical protein